MNLDLEDVLELTRRVTRDVVAGEAAQCDVDAVWPEASMRALLAEGLGGLVVPREYGGLGHGLASVIRVCEVIGRESGSAAICLGMHYVASAVISAKATDYQIEKYLKPICAGRHITTLSLSEPGTGAHFYYPETRLLRQADGSYRLNGQKSFATNGGHADSYVASAVAGEADAPPGMFSCVMLEEGTPGMTWQGEFKGFGMRGNSSRGFVLDNVAIDGKDLLGEEGDQIWYIFNVVAPYFLVAMAGTYLGIADRAVQEVIDHLQRRVYQHKGQSLDQEPVLQHKLGTLWAKLERTRRLVYWAAQEADAGGENSLPALCSAKAEVGDTAVDICNDAMTLAGGIAYGVNAVLPRLLRDARAAHVMAPTTDILRTWTARALLGIPLLAE